MLCGIHNLKKISRNILITFKEYLVIYNSMENNIDDVILKICKTCNEAKNINLFRSKHLTCRSCNSKKNYNNLNENNYFKQKYEEDRKYRLEYQMKRYDLIRKKPRKNSLEISIL
jgi:hypothetical protein